MAEGSAVAIQAYLNLNGIVWKLMTDGSLVPLEPGETVQADIPFLEFPESSPDADLASSSSQSSLASFFANVSREGGTDIPSSGYDTRGVSVDRGSERDAKQGPPPDLLPNDAGITIEILDGGDGYVNRFEQGAVDLVGTTTNILDDVVVDVIVMDSQGGSVTFQAVVLNDRFEVPDADLSSLAEGPIVVIATYQDPYGNRVSATDDSIKDTLASGVDVEADTGADDVVNAVEAVDNTLSGTFANVQAGAEVNVTVSGAGHGDLVFTATLDGNGNWSIPDVDLEVFDDGTLTLTAETVDQAGNPASITDTVEMDTQAAITAEFVDAVQPDGVGGYLNADEGQMTSFTGTVNEVEDGQTVTLVITDEAGGSLTFTTQVSGGAWQLDNQDLSSLAPGELTLEASVEDVAGNPATATDTIIYDPIAEISRPITSDVGRILNAAEVSNVDFNGSVNDVEPGRELDIVIEDGSGNSASGSATVQPDGTWSLTGVDVTGLDEGLLTLSVTGTDLAGNEATLETFYFKDTLNDLTAEFVDEQTPDGVGGYYNADEASDGVTLQGSANFISDGLPVDVQVRDTLGNVVEVSGVTISGGTWQADNVDLSGLEPGQIFVLASTTDFAGNPAFGVDSFIYDPIAIINDDVTSPAFSVPVVDDNTVNAAEVAAGRSAQGNRSAYRHPAGAL